MNGWSRLSKLEIWPELAWSAGILLGAVLIGLIVYGVLFRGLLRLAARPDSALQHALVRRWRPPARLLLPMVFLLLATPALPLPAEAAGLLRHGLILVFIGAMAWLLAVTLLGLRELILERYDLEKRDNLKARAVHTQVNVLVKILLVAIFLLAGASMLMTFDRVRQVGVSLLASAGIVGIIAGFAAQRSLATLFAGIQIAITQPIRLDDVVIVEGEWGRIEEITLTYVVVRIWDQRRLIVPITYFLEKPFQNWTRTSADLLGTVILYADFRLPVEALREELRRVLGDCPEWDGKVAGIQVTGATEHSMEVRALVSAGDSSAAWDLRCQVREKLLDFLRREYPESLPRVRAEIGEDQEAARPPG